MAMLIINGKYNEDKLSELAYKFKKDYSDLNREMGIVDARDSITFDEKGIDHDTFLRRLEWEVNNYIYNVIKLPKDMMTYIWDPIRMEVYIYEWRSGYLLELPRIHRG